ncbi:MAG TPA: FAD-dependent oxidoreductase [Solirubrobacter sp.]|nr:FAD-dependent oxidoreductase [Solirubrobacter sp.]
MSSELQVDVAVVGGGPAGMAAAVTARRAGAAVAVIDEYAAPGGQIWRRRFDEAGEAAPRSLPDEGRARVAAFAACGATLLAGRSVWGTPEPGVLLLTGAGPSVVRAGAIVLATGAYDRPVAFPGWTLPGVLTAGGAQALAKGQGVLPGRRVLLAGAGPFLLPVAAQLAALGAEVVAVAEATRRRDWLAAAPRMAAHPGRLAEYARYRRRVRRIVWGHAIARAEGDGRVQRATLVPVGPDWAPCGRERSFEVDAVCTAYGFLPSVDLARALGCELAGDAVAHDADMATSVAGVFVAGEASGVGGAELAVAEGELAGAAAAAHVVASPPPRAAASSPRVAAPDLAALRARRAKLAAFADVLADLFDPRPGLLALAAPDTVLCRCEDVTAGAVDAAVAAGARTPSALKILTRCGQGPCQGRVCERLVAARVPEPERYHARAPLRPIPLGLLIDAAIDA